MSTPPSVVFAPAAQNITMTPDQLSALVEAEVAKALAAQPKGVTWAQIRGNKYFVAFTSGLSGALVSEIFEAVRNHAFVWNKQSIEAMITAAVGTAATSLYHLYQQPNPPTDTKD